MNNYKYLTLALLLLTSCTKATFQEVNSPKELNFNISMQEDNMLTKATSTAFEPNDAISLFAVEYYDGVQIPLQVSGNYINNEKVNFDGVKWQPSRTLYWSDAACDFYALYPYQDNFDSVEEYPFSIVADQSNVGYEKSDLIYARAEKVSRTVDGVELKFRHIMARCVVNVVKGETFEGDIPDDISIHLYNTITNASVNISNGSFSFNALANRDVITMRKISQNQFEALVIPQKVEKAPLVEISMGGISYLLESSILFKGGYTHTFNVTLNYSPEQELIEISIDPSIKNW